MMRYEVACSDTTTVIKELKETFEEQPYVIGQVQPHGVLLIVWKGTKSDNFTITVTSEARNITCSLVEGSDLQLVNEKDKNAKPTGLH